MTDERDDQGERPDVRVKVLSADAVVPAYAHEGDAGADLYAAEGVELAPFARAVVATGVAIALPAGHAGFIHPRSGLSSKHGVTVVNAPGTIDAGYRGEIKVPLINLDPHTTYTVARGDRIAQLVVQAVAHARFRTVDALEDTGRGAGGFGSTGGFSTSE
ncbi:dUTP diphosphatase [Brevibacterium jeotgali]|uniref:Deoxyuridine 5'-triphosphate nucleotidohydrolase n=1 Tax=Brevibacterium jeotgali TaxID=1262550 RepID=A0A2H1L894_9MICO|nr:deoxyuridine 5'-triphosphate nucleotidohydrolase [Brevibacterium jeotgali]SMY12593.1 deoxyuridine 5'-triphosphate nucleotidohydrolase [Brevibacterium jeotgali]